MAFLTAGQISRLAIELMTRRLVLANTVERVPGDEFRGSNGDTVTIRVPVPRDANIQSTPGADIDTAPIDEDEAEVSVVQVYDAAPVTDHDLTLSIQNYGRQVLRPMTDAVARGSEDQLAGAMNDVPADASYAETVDNDDTKDRLLEAWEELTDADVPPDDRFYAASAQIAARIMRHPEFTRVDASGSPQTLRRGVIGGLYGFTIVVSTGLGAGTGVAYHRSSFGFATFPTAEMDGQAAVQSSVVTDQGISLRTLRQWNPHKLQQEQVVTCFAGAGLVDADRVFKHDTDTNGS